MLRSDNSETGTVVYAEMLDVSTNANGLISIQIGNGDSPAGLFNEIDWSAGPFLGGTLVTGGKLKEAGTSHWKTPNTGATNETGFTALSGGDRLPEGIFGYLGERVHFWASGTTGTLGNFIGLYFDSSNALQDATYKNVGFYVRGLKD